MFMLLLCTDSNLNINPRVLVGPQTLVTTSNGGILINSHIWELAIDEENFSTVELDHPCCQFQETKMGPRLRTDSRPPSRVLGRAFCQISIWSGNSALATLKASGAMWTCWEPCSSIRWTRGKGIKLL